MAASENPPTQIRCKKKKRFPFVQILIKLPNEDRRYKYLHIFIVYKPKRSIVGPTDRNRIKNNNFFLN